MPIDIQCTPAQQEVIAAPQNANTLLNVIAGPGSGKTRTLCSRLAYLMSKEGGQLAPEEILVLSLTNRAVDDFKHKLCKLVGEEVAGRANVMTFHAFAAAVIREKYDDWQIVEDEELRSLCELVPKAGNKKQSETLSRMRELIRRTRYEDADKIDWDKYEFDRQTFSKIRSLVGAQSMFTYDDILYECVRMLESAEPEFVQKYKVVVVDEFQDVYPLLADIIVSLARGRHLTIAGDPNQSIYGFMGATADKNWKRVAALYDHDAKKLVTLSHAFRATPELLDLSSKILGSSNQANVNECVKDSVDLPAVRMSFDSVESELEFIHSEIQRLVRESNGMIKNSDVAILSFTNSEVDSAYNFFKAKHSTGSATLGVNRLNSTPQWLRTQLSNLLQYMKILIDPHQNFPLLTALNLVPGVGLSTINRLYQAATSNHISVYELLTTEQKCLKGVRVPKNIPLFISFITEARAKLDQNDPNAIMVTLLEIGNRFGLKHRLITSKVSDIQLDEYESCLRSIHKSLEQNLELKPDGEPLLHFYLNNYNSHVLLDPNSNFAKLYNDDEVNFATIHMAKGLEFPVVFILSPNNCHLNKMRRRVLYVGVTRASALLYFNKLHNQRVFGIDQVTSPAQPKTPTRAAMPVDDESIQRMKVLEWHAQQYCGDYTTPSTLLLHKPPQLGATGLPRLLAIMGKHLTGNFTRKLTHH